MVELDATLNRGLCLCSNAALDAGDIGMSEGELTALPLAEAVERFRSEYLDRALGYFSGNRSQAARALGIDVRTIFRHLEARKKK